jgi:threonine dehydrogenase-like Zn-dependent dehydrogenase
VVSDLLILRQVRVQGVFGASSRAWRCMVDLFASSDLRLERLVTHRFCLEDYAQAFAAVRDTSVGAVKVQLHP